MFTGQKHFFILSLLPLVFLQGCASSMEYYKLPAKVSEKTFNAVIEIPERLAKMVLKKHDIFKIRD